MYNIAPKIGRENNQSKYDQENGQNIGDGNTTKSFMHAEIIDI